MNKKIFTENREGWWVYVWIGFDFIPVARWWQLKRVLFSPLLGEMIQFDKNKCFQK